MKSDKDDLPPPSEQVRDERPARSPYDRIATARAGQRPLSEQAARLRQNRGADNDPDA